MKLRMGLNPYGLTYTLGLQGRGTPRANPRATGLAGFLSLAAEQGYCIDDYEDAAEGFMGRDAAGHVAILHVTLRPKVRCSGTKQPNAEQLLSLHHAAHEQCFIANSVRTELRIEPVP